MCGDDVIDAGAVYPGHARRKRCVPRAPPGIARGYAVSGRAVGSVRAARAPYGGCMFGRGLARCGSGRLLLGPGAFTAVTPTHPERSEDIEAVTFIRPAFHFERPVRADPDGEIGVLPAVNRTNGTLPASSWPPQLPVGRQGRQGVFCDGRPFVGRWRTASHACPSRASYPTFPTLAPGVDFPVFLCRIGIRHLVRCHRPGSPIPQPIFEAPRRCQRRGASIFDQLLRRRQAGKCSSANALLIVLAIEWS